MLPFKASGSDMENYTISLNGWENSTRSFDFKVENTFFDLFDHSPISEGDLDIAIKVEKSERIIRVDGHLIGTVNVECDRCLDPFDLLIEGSFGIFAKPEEGHEGNIIDDDETLYYSTSEGILDLAELIYNYIILSIPLKKIHPVDTGGNSLCNAEMIKYLKTNNKKQDSDPRWEALNKLK